MKRVILFFALMFAPAILLANSESVEVDIVQRTFNFILFVAIMWYLLADKIKEFFANRSLGIQAELDKVQDALKASQDKVNQANKELEDAKKLAVEIVNAAKDDIDNVKQKVVSGVETDIAHLEKNLNEMIKVETSKAKKQIVEEVLDELLKSKNVNLSQKELINIVLKKVA